MGFSCPFILPNICRASVELTNESTPGCVHVYLEDKNTHKTSHIELPGLAGRAEAVFITGDAHAY